MEDAVPYRSFYVIKIHDFERKCFCSPWRPERETVAGVLLGSFAMVGSQSREGNRTSFMSEFTCQCSHSSCWYQSCVRAGGCYPTVVQTLVEIVFASFALVG
jgi:hypothetical protein